MLSISKFTDLTPLINVFTGAKAERLQILLDDKIDEDQDQ
jgi:hypothetical protein